MAACVIDISCEALGDCRVARVSGSERLSALTDLRVEVVSADGDVSLKGAVHAPARLTLRDELEGSARPIDLVIRHIAYEGAERDGHRYALALAPAEHALALRSGYRIFLDKGTQEIVAEVLEDAGVPADRVVWRLGRTYVQRPQCTQYGESAWAFIERLLGDEGISYWFDFLEGKGAVIVFGDAPGSHEGMLAPDTLPFLDPSGLPGIRFFSELSVCEALAPEAAHVRELDIRNPDVYIEGKAGDGLLSYFEYPALVADEAAARARAETRLAQLQRYKVTAVASSDCARVQPGRIVRVEGCADEAMNVAYLVVAVEHAYASALPHAPEGEPYRNRVLMVPASAPFRPAIPASRPRFDGVELAVTTGAPGEEIHVDDLGQVRLRFLWDRSGITDDRSSRWARCLQMGMGGSMLLPRVGWEVPVMYIDGNPDAPFVVGRLYNATAVVPYALPAAAATTSLQSATSPGGGSVNELRLGDEAGSQEMYLHASRDQSVNVGGSSTTTVTGDEIHDVGEALAVVVQGAQTQAIGGSQTVNIGTDERIQAEGSISKTIGAMEHISVTGDRIVQAEGACTEVVVGAYGLQCNQSNLKVQGGFVQMIGARMAFATGLGMTESVAMGRFEGVGGSYNIICGGLNGDTVRGLKRVTAGASSEEADGGWAVAAKAAGQVGAGSASMTATGPLLVTAQRITVDVTGAITAGVMEIGGGKVKATGGTTSVKGTTTKRPAGAKIT